MNYPDNFDSAAFDARWGDHERKPDRDDWRKWESMLVNKVVALIDAEFKASDFASIDGFDRQDVHNHVSDALGDAFGEVWGNLD